MKLLSVNVGHPRPNPWKEIKLTGIDKRPVEGPVMVTPARAKGLGMVGLVGDRVYDVRNHGGPDQAVYAYAREDLTYGGSRGRGCSLDLLGCLSERIERSWIAVDLPLRMDIEKDQGIKTIPTGSAKQTGDLGRSLRVPADRHFADHDGLLRDGLDLGDSLAEGRGE